MATQPNKGKANKSTYSSKPKPSPTPWIIGGVVVLALLGGGWYAWQGQRSGDSFEALVAQGKPALSQVDSRPDKGRGHTEAGATINYEEDPPTSGIHWPTWVNAGFYSQTQPKPMLVHALEHGNIVVYYDSNPEAVNTLKAWTRKFNGQWDGMVMVPQQGLGSTTVLTAWNKILRLESWDAAAAAAFIDAYRGRGPENPVR